MYLEKKIIDLKKFPLIQTKNYSFVYNDQLYIGEFIKKKNKLSIPPQTIFFFREFTLNNHILQPFNVLFLEELENSQNNMYFSDSETDSETESETNSKNENINNNVNNDIDDNDDDESDYYLVNGIYSENIDENYEYIIT
jgi:hypothetical protein